MLSPRAIALLAVVALVAAAVAEARAQMDGVGDDWNLNTVMRVLDETHDEAGAAPSATSNAGAGARGGGGAHRGNGH